MLDSRRSGFTIVELLIVIVVIGILAAITIVAFNGVQERAHDTSIQNDLKNIAKKYELYKVDNDHYPYGADLNSGAAIRVNISKDAYDASSSFQLLNCTNSSSFGADYAVLALSKSGKKFYVSSESGGNPREYTGSETWVQGSSCADVLTGATGNGAGYSTTWRAWTAE